KKETITVPRKKRIKTIVEETGKSEELADSVSLEETKVNDEERQGKGSSVVPETPDYQSSSGSSRSRSDDEEGFLQTDDEELKDKSDNERTETYNSDDAGKEKIAKDQELVQEKVMEKPAIPPPSPNHTLSYAEYGNQLINDNGVILIKDILQDTVETETQSMVDVPIHQDNLAVQQTPLVDAIVSILLENTTHSPKPQPPQSKTKIILKKPNKPDEKVNAEAILKRLMKLVKKVEAMSKIDHTKAIDKSVQAHLKNVLPKAVSDFGKIKQEKHAQEFKTYPAHQKLYDALMDSLLVDEDDMDKRYK
ncbi:hypothetical protein Tco_1232231, partial [Tanacetum coccineum]